MRWQYNTQPFAQSLQLCLSRTLAAWIQTPFRPPPPTLDQKPRSPPHSQSPWFYLRRENFHECNHTRISPGAWERPRPLAPTFPVSACLASHLPSYVSCDSRSHPLLIIPNRGSQQHLLFLLPPSLA